ncbi:MAG: rod shape-determining protein RodA [Deltaproteobacteria bacterium]|nr:rod shape-determining protein RodA [Deltaproteobacteria bacterium]
MIDRRHLSQIDFFLVAVTFSLAVIGLFNIYSATRLEDTPFYAKQLTWFIIGLIVSLPLILISYSTIEKFAYHIYGISIASLVLVLIAGTRIAGAKRWLSLGFMNIQPSELAKIALIIALAAYLSKKKADRWGLGIRELIIPGLIFIVPFLLIAKQPDLGTGLILAAIAVSMILIVRVTWVALILTCVSMAAFIPFAWRFLKDYQKARLLSFIDPSMDPLGSGYHTFQSKIAIGSGGFTGKGYLQGTQGSLYFLPEHHTDFVFPVFAEEWGFLGAIVVMFLFMVLILRGIDIANKSKDRFGFLLAFGFTALIFWHVTMNAFMVIGFLPVVGVPMPFLSYGGSFLLSTMIAIALLINIHMRRFMF